MDKELLLKRKAVDGTRKVPIEGVGDVTVRGLSRSEVKAAQQLPEDERENVLIALAIVDPELTPEEVGEWLDSAPAGDSTAVMDAVAELSGMSEGARKSGVPGVRKRRGR